MAIDPYVFDRYRARGLTDAGLQYIQCVRRSPPARRVGGTRFLAVSSRFPSAKMGCTIQAESRTGEYPLVLALELDDDVLEYYDQPTSVLVSRTRRGRLHVSRYTPDFLVLRHEQVELIEVKTRAALEKAREKYPDEWVEQDGCWRCLPIASSFHNMGIPHRIHVAEEIGGVMAANLNILVPATRLDPLPNEEAALEAGKRLLASGEVVTISQFSATLNLSNASAVFRWIARGHFQVALKHQLITAVYSTRLFLSTEARDNYIAVRNIGRLHVEAEETDVAQSTDVLTDRQIALALSRYQAALPVIRKEAPSTRQQRRYLQRMKQALLAAENPLAAFAPRHELRGNRQTRLEPEQEALMLAAINSYYKTPARRSARWVYLSISWGSVRRVSYQTFLARVRRQPKHDVARARSGHRAARALAPPTHPFVRAVWPTSAWELVHIDHTAIDEKVWGNLGVAQVLERPWITTMIDAWSECVLAFWISFSSPSWHSLAMLLRDCVRRHGHLPLAWISDQGPEFGGTFWEVFSASYNCTKMERAVADGRGGSQVERSFNNLHRDLIYQLDGNMQNDRDFRKATSSHKSGATARFLLERIYTEIDYYLFQYYNERPHGPNAFSPLDRLKESVNNIGQLSRPIPYDRAFRIDTAQRLEATGYTIKSRIGICVGQRSYWHEAMAQPRFHRLKVEAREEPFDSSLVYAHLGGQWVDCVAKSHTELTCLDEFGRWAQSAIELYGKSLIATTKRVIDERYAQRQKATWTSECWGEIPPPTDLIVKGASNMRLRLSTDAKDMLDVPSTSRPAAAAKKARLEGFRDITVEPLEEFNQ